MSIPPSRSHPERILAGVVEGVEDMEPVILGSWRRSVLQYRLDPARQAAPRVLTGSHLRMRREPMEPLMRIARGGVETLYQNIHEAGYVVLLTDPEGVTVDFIGNPHRDRELRKAGLYLGSCWSEAEEGTCAVGIVIAEQKPLTVHHDEHFRSPHTGLTCSAAPLFDADGSLLGVLDASSLHSPYDKRSQHLVLQLVKDTARAIENANIMERYGHLSIVRFSSRREFVEVTTEGLLAVDQGGYIVASNLLARAALQGIPGKLIGHLFDAVFETSLTMLMCRSTSPQSPVQAIRVCGSSMVFYAQVHAPRGKSLRPTATKVVQAETRVSTVGDSKRLFQLAGNDPRMAHNLQQALRVINKGIPVMLCGETGTGKEVFAQAIHLASGRAEKPFVAINCGAIPESLIESELFGYTTGTFTGAAKGGMKGKIASADGGTLFLDEIGDMPLTLQTRLLRVLAERQVTPLGAERPVSVDIQVICATHRDLRTMIATGTFREDLYYRLSGLRMLLPPLRERADKRELFQSILAQVAEALGHSQVELTQAALDAMERYGWPGNIRQLVSVLRAALALSDSGIIDLDNIAGEMGPDEKFRPLLSEPVVSDSPASLDENQPSEAVELINALRRHGWNVSRTAESLGIARATAYRRIEKYRISSPNHRDRL